MTWINENYLKLQAGYLFPEIGRRRRAFAAADPEAKIISMGIGDVTQPLAPAVTRAMKKAVEEMGRAESFRGYDDGGIGYEFLRQAIRDNDYKTRGVDIDIDEIIISDGAKCDTGNMQEIFGLDNVVGICDPVYPVYVDTNVMAGRTGGWVEIGSAIGELKSKIENRKLVVSEVEPSKIGSGRYEGIVYMPCTEDNNFVPEPPAEKVDLIYLCFPNNPTGAVATKEQLAEWVDYAAKNRAIILFDAAYEAFIRDTEIPHSIYEVDGAKDVAIEFRSFSKTAGFTGVRCAFTVVPKQLKAHTKDGREVEVGPIWKRRHCTKFNGVSYVTQAGAAAIYTQDGKKQVKETIDLYMGNARLIRETLSDIGYTVYGGVNAPYIWLKTPDGVGSWEFFDRLLNEAHVVSTPGAGFGSAGEGFLRLTAFGQPQSVQEALERIKAIS